MNGTGSAREDDSRRNASSRRGRAATLVLVALLIAPLLSATSVAQVTSIPQRGSWEPPVLVESDNASSAGQSQLAVAPDGTAVAVWTLRVGAFERVWANRFTPSGGWGTPERIEEEDLGDAFAPQVAVDGAGNAVAVWYQFDGVHYNIWANRYLAASGWETAQLLEGDNSGQAFAPDVAVDAVGDAFAVWIQSDGLRVNTLASRYVQGTGWEPPVLIEGNDDGDTEGARVAVDAQGNAVAVWSLYNYTLYRYTAYANRFTNGSGWGSAQAIQAGYAVGASVQVAMDSTGSATAVWIEYDGGYKVLANRLFPGTGWATAQTIATLQGNANDPQVAMDGRGNAMAVWRNEDGYTQYTNSVWANRYIAGVGWGTPELLESRYETAVERPQVALNASGNAVVVWRQYDGPQLSIWANRYTPQFGWTSARLVEFDNAGDARNPHVGMDASGNAMAVWEQWSAAHGLVGVQAGRYVVPAPIPPVLTLDEPVEGAFTQKPFAWVSGSTELGIVLTIGGVRAVVNDNGTFRSLVTLRPGENRVEVVAVNEFGEVSRVAVNVSYGDPIPGLEAAVDAALVNLTEANARVTALESSGNATQRDLDVAESQLTAARAQLAIAGGDLASAQGRVGTLEVLVNGTATDLAVAQGQLEVAAADLQSANERIAALESRDSATEAAVEAADRNLTAARDDLTAALGRVHSLETAAADKDQSIASATSEITNTQGAASLATMTGLAGIVVGLLGVAMALRARPRAEGADEEPAAERTGGPQPPPAPPLAPPPTRGDADARWRGPRDFAPELSPCPRCGKRIEALAPQCPSCGLELSWQ